MPSRGPRQIVDRLTPALSTYESFAASHLVPNTPCIFPPSLVQHWSLFDKWFSDPTELNFGYLLEHYGSLEVDCVECGSGEEAEVVSRFGQLLELWKAGSGRRKYLKDWHLPLTIQKSAGSTTKGKEKLAQELYDVVPVCLDDWMNEHECNECVGKGDDFRFVYAGGGDTFTPLHRDVYCSYSISTQIFGRKLWYLFPPECTASLLPLITRANREGSGVNCDEWPDSLKEDFAQRGMLKVWQEPKETIFIPSGWYHSVHNLDHPTISLNHNWSNSHNLPSIYHSLCQEVARCREAIRDVKELLIEKAKREGKQAEGENAWKSEWEAEVDRLVERSEGWSWRTFWGMILNTLKSLEVSREELERRFAHSRWPVVPPEARPPTRFVLKQLQPLLDDFRNREEGELTWLDGLDRVFKSVQQEISRLSHETISQ